MFRTTSAGDWSKTKAWLNRMTKSNFFSDLHGYGEMGVLALSENTPVNTGELARSWRYRIINTPTGVGIEWYNVNVEDDIPIAIIVQYGHGTGTGGYVQGIDYINPAIRPVFEKAAADLERKVNGG